MEKTQYKDIFKGTAIFGGTQFFQILITILRGKMVSVLIGAKGMGVNSLYLTSTATIINMSSLGLNSSSVREYAELQKDLEKAEFSKKISIINKCFCFTYILGLLITILLSPVLSKLSFNSFNYTINYGALSLYVVFQLMGMQYTSILQGFHLIKKLALSSLYSSVITLFSATIMYYYWGIDGIVPNIILSSFLGLLFRIYPVKKLRLPKIKVSFRESLKEGHDMVFLGIITIVSVLIGNLVNYLINIVIIKYGNISDVGFFQAANSIVLQSVSMIFASMTADYYPKLVQVSNNVFKTNELVNKQTEILSYLAIPVLSMMIICAPILIKILLSNEFLVITNFIKWVCLATIFQVFSYPIGSISFAKGDKKIFFFTEGLGSSICRLVFYSVGYCLGGLFGLAIGMCLTNFLYLIVINIITNKIYDYKLDRNVLTKYLFVIPMFCITLISSLHNVFFYIMAVLVVIIISFYNLYMLNLKTEIVKTVFKILKKR